jgi:N-acetyltransferase
MRVEPVTLEGSTIRLEPLDDRYAADLLEAGAHDEIWTYLDEPTPRSLDAIQGLIAEALKEQADGERLPFAIIDRSTDRAIGSVSYIDIQPVHHGLEIGWAWVTPAVGRPRQPRSRNTPHRPRLQPAAGHPGRLQDRRPQRALAARDRALRRHPRRRLPPSPHPQYGHLRDSIYYSLLADEWPPAHTSSERAS